MGTFVMFKEPCPLCGEIEKVELKQKAAPISCWYVVCGKCGHETAKHKTAEDAVRDWNRRKVDEDGTEA